MENNSKHLNGFLFWLIIFGAFIGNFLAARYNSLLHVLFLNMIISGLVFWFYLSSRNYLKNIGLFALSIFLVFVAFPCFHFGLYSINNKNYALSPDYIQSRKTEIKNELNPYNDIQGIKILKKNLEQSKIDFLITDKQIDKTLSLTDYELKIFPRQHFGRPKRSGGGFKTVICYNENSLEICRINLTEDASLLKCIDTEIKKYNRINYQLTHPSRELLYSDLFLDSISGFVLGNAKPISLSSQLIQLFQFVAIFFFGYFFIGYVESNFDIQIKKKRSNKK